MHFALAARPGTATATFHSKRNARCHGAQRATCAHGVGDSAESPPNSLHSALERAVLPLLAAGVVAASYAEAVAAEAVTATPQQQVGEVTDVFEPFVPLAIGAATTTTTIAVVSVARTLQGKEEQRKRLLKLRTEVTALQELQKEELALLGAQLKGSVEEFQHGFDNLQTGAEHQSHDMSTLQHQLSTAQQEVSALAAEAAAEAAERRRAEAAAGKQEAEVQRLQRAQRDLQDKAADLEARLADARWEAEQANAALADSQSRILDVEEGWRAAVDGSPTSNLAPLSNEVLQAGGHGRRDADGSRLQGEVQQAEELVQALAQEVERAQRAAAAARDELASVQQRNRGLEHQWVAASGEANQLRGEKQGLQAALTQVQREARVLAGQLEEARGLVGQLEEAQQAAAAANGMLDSLRSRTAMLEKAWAGSMKDSQAAAQLRKQQQKLETALGRAQQEASALSTQLGAALKDAATAKALLSMSSGRNALVEKAWQAAQEDAASLRAQQRSMQAALSSAQREARTLAAELEMARAQQQQEQQGGWQSDQPDHDVSALRSRVSLVEKARTRAEEDARAEAERRREIERQLHSAQQQAARLEAELERAQAGFEVLETRQYARV